MLIIIGEFGKTKKTTKKEKKKKRKYNLHTLDTLFLHDRGPTSTEKRSYIFNYAQNDEKFNQYGVREQVQYKGIP